VGGGGLTARDGPHPVPGGEIESVIAIVPAGCVGRVCPGAFPLGSAPQFRRCGTLPTHSQDRRKGNYPVRRIDKDRML
jgi:hypothetical protein